LSTTLIRKRIACYAIATVLAALTANGTELVAPAAPKGQFATQLVVAPSYLLAIPEPILRNNEQTLAARTVARVLDELRDAELHGLDSEDYNVATLTDLNHSLFARRMSSAEISFADAFAKRAMLGYVLDLAFGSKKLRRQEIDNIETDLAAALVSDTLNAYVSELIPQHRDYRALQDVLVHLQQQRINGGWPIVATGRTLEIGTVSPRVSTLRHRLGVSGEATGSDVFDEALHDAVLAYQSLHGLDADGKAGKRTIDHLNRSVEFRIAQTRKTLARWREAPLPTTGRFVHVNVPSYGLRYARPTENDLTMRVIVGGKNTPTPIFNDEIEYLVFSPYWDVPRSITVNEILPSTRQDSDYLRRGNYEIVDENGVVAADSVDLANATAENFPYRLRQKPGNENSLGLVKFIFPNSHSVYLHDTPADSLFSLSNRALSHGCVRVEYPAELAAAMLADNPKWNGDRVATAMHGKTPDYVNLETPIPVHITYFTVITTDSGEAGFFDDIYGHEKVSRKLLASSRLSNFPIDPKLHMASTSISR